MNSMLYVNNNECNDKRKLNGRFLLYSPHQMDSQMEALYDYCKMTPVAKKLRFMACQQLERSVSGLFPYAEIIPFGSTVNSFGRFDADLDMIFSQTPAWVRYSHV